VSTCQRKGSKIDGRLRECQRDRPLRLADSGATPWIATCPALPFPVCMPPSSPRIRRSRSRTNY